MEGGHTGSDTPHLVRRPHQASLLETGIGARQRARLESMVRRTGTVGKVRRPLTLVLTGSQPGLQPEHLLGGLASSGPRLISSCWAALRLLFATPAPQWAPGSPESRWRPVPHRILACSPRDIYALSPSTEDRAETAPGGSCGIPEWAWDIQRTGQNSVGEQEQLG